MSQRANQQVEVEHYMDSWGVFAVGRDYPIALCGGKEDAEYIARLWNAARSDNAETTGAA